MTTTSPNILPGRTPVQPEQHLPQGTYVQIMGETFYRIAHYDQMPPFFMSLVSSADHWLFIASTGGLTAGRVNADSALFPYETEDKITAHSEQTGSKTIVRVTRNGRTHLWEPFSERYRGLYHCERHLYKNIYGSKLIFEEINHDLDLTMRTAWRTGDRFGFIKSGRLSNQGGSECHVELLDGLQNLLPYGANSGLQTNMSSLLHAYKRNELEPETGLGIFALSATLSDRAEPSESLKATVAWQVGLDVDCHFLSTEQIDVFRFGRPLTPEYDVCGKAGAYFALSAFSLPPGAHKAWHITADVNQDSAAVTSLVNFLRQDKAAVQQCLEDDIDWNTASLISRVAAADGLQRSAEETTSAHHFANVLFNIMRGGIFTNGYMVDRHDLLDFMQVRNRAVLEGHAGWLEALPAQLNIRDLYAQAAETADPDLIRLCYEYLPLTFSRRHGDPSRPWNRFSINLKKADGSPRLDYQGNWRDIFQNWEPLAVSFPDYIEGLIAKFLNATTADGYNPYRVTRDGIEWEVPNPDDPWSNIGYWSDHQIIYLQKLLEIAEQVHPGRLLSLSNRPIFTYADVPYRIRSYQEMLDDWSNTIVFDWKKEREIETAVSRTGTDGRLASNGEGQIIHATLTEKLLALLLAKLANLVPEGGVWMNTQRPEWNDANNALVGKGLSVVTTAYLRRFVVFWLARLAAGAHSFVVNAVLADLFTAIHNILTQYQPNLQTGFDDGRRRAMMDALGSAVTDYRRAVYQDGILAGQREIETADLQAFLSLAQAYIEQTLQANKRLDGLYHAYNILKLGDQSAAVEQLYLMLEGQVAILSSGLLAPAEALDLLRKLRQSDLYRADQHSYMLYPNRRLPGFRQKNNITPHQVAGSALAARLAEAGDRRLLIRDEDGVFHFNGRFHNAGDVAQTLDTLAQEPAYGALVTAERSVILDLFEATFNHRAFTGRSGTFFAYEGLGSIYWHMVSKLLLAAQEVYQQVLREGTDAAVVEGLAAVYYDIRQGLGYHKTPAVYGAFPTDPYSHTPIGSGARQPGMTGQVKEEILTRWGELGLSVRDGTLRFAPTLLQPEEFLSEPDTFDYVDTAGRPQTLTLPAHSLAFTFCQTPVVYTLGDKARIQVGFEDGRSEIITGSRLDQPLAQQIFDRTGYIHHIMVSIESIVR